MSFKKIFIVTFLLCLYFCITGCSEDQSQNTTESSTDISGEWALTLKMTESHLDTNGVKSNDLFVNNNFESTIDEVLLYQTGDHEVEGIAGLFKLSGTINGNQLILNVYEHPDGPVEFMRPIESMIHISTITATLRNNNMFSGTGIFVNDPSNSGLLDDKYTIEAHKTNDLSLKANKKEIKESIQNKLCNLTFAGVSFITGILTDNVFRPMSDCWIHKSGGGYFVFGHEGPGSILPIWTQTVYYPYELTSCKTRTYKFNINLGDEVWSLEALEDILKNKPPKGSMLDILGMTTIDSLISAIIDFRQNYGAFAVSFAYSSRTRNYSIYVNVERGSYSNVIKEPFIIGLMTYLEGFGGSVDIFVGKDIDDSWSLTRSGYFVCNTPVIFCYLFGTNKVTYN